MDFSQAVLAILDARSRLANWQLLRRQLGSDRMRELLIEETEKMRLEELIG